MTEAETTTLGTPWTAKVESVETQMRRHICRVI